jgi:hypothetical protein
MSKFSKELLGGFKWVAIILTSIAVIIIAWIGAAWGLGYLINHVFDLKSFGPHNYISFGSFVLVFGLVIIITTIVLTGWALISYGRSRGLIKKVNGN